MLQEEQVLPMSLSKSCTVCKKGYGEVLLEKGLLEGQLEA